MVRLDTMMDRILGTQQQQQQTTTQCEGQSMFLDNDGWIEIY